MVLKFAMCCSAYSTMLTVPFMDAGTILVLENTQILLISAVAINNQSLNMATPSTNVLIHAQFTGNDSLHRYSVCTCLCMYLSVYVPVCVVDNINNSETSGFALGFPNYYNTSKSHTYLSLIHKS